MMYMYILMICSSLMFFSLNSMFLGGLVIFQCFVYSLLISWTLFSSWFAYILFIIILGGILILFVYVISMISNQLILPDEVDFSTLLLGPLIFLFDYHFSLSKDLFLFSEISFFEMEQNIFMYKIHNLVNLKMSIFLMVYLFFCLIVVVYLVDLKEGSFRSI